MTGKRLYADGLWCVLPEFGEVRWAFNMKPPDWNFFSIVTNDALDLTLGEFDGFAARSHLWPEIISKRTVYDALYMSLGRFYGFQAQSLMWLEENFNPSEFWWVWWSRNLVLYVKRWREVVWQGAIWYDTVRQRATVGSMVRQSPTWNDTMRHGATWYAWCEMERYGAT